MPTVDNKIVQMTFENKQFERGVKQSLTSLEELKKALDLDKSAQSLANLEKAAARFDISAIGNGVDKIADKFTLLGNIGQEIFKRISKTAVDAMEQVARTITAMPQAGLSKYEQKNKAVQVIQGALPEKSLEEIEEVLGRLNEYTDLTSYDFAQMASTIGKFTAAGVDLEVAERVMEGIANEAASAGGEVAQANIAMYNFSQALAAGAVKLQDWRSISNQNLDTQEFKETIIDTASALGILEKKGKGVGVLTKKTSKGVQKITVDYKTFANTLSEGWFTSDVLIKTMEKYADRESEVGKKGFEMAKVAITLTQAFDAVKDAISTQWMKTWQLIFGNLEEASALFTRISDALIDFTDKIGNFRNSILEGWHTGGEDGISGYTMAIDALADSWHVLMGIVEAARQAFAEVFGELDSSGLLQFTAEFRNLAKEAAEYFGYSVEETSHMGPVWEITDGIPEWTHMIQKGMEGVDVENLQKRLRALKDPLISLDKYGADGIFGPETEAALKAFQKSVGLLETGIYDQATRDALAKALYPNGKKEKFVKEITETTEHIGSGLDLVKRAFRGVLSIVKAGLGIFKVGLTVVGKVAKMLTPVANGILSLVAGLGDLATYTVDVVTALFSGEDAVAAFNVVLLPLQTILNTIGGALYNFGDGLSKIVAIARSATNFEALGEMLRLNPEENANAIAIYDFLVKIRDMALKVAPAFSGVFETLKGFYETARDWLSEKLESAIQTVSTFFTDLWKTIEEGDYVTKVFNGIGTVLQIVVSIVGGLAYGFYSLIKSVVEGAKALYNFAVNSEFVQNILRGISDFFAPVKDFFASVWTSLTNLTGLFPTFKDFESFWNAFMAQMASNPIGTKFIPALSKLKTAIAEPFKKMKAFFGLFKDAIKFLTAKNKKTAIDALLGDPENRERGKKVIELATKIKKVLTTIRTVARSIKQAVVNVFEKVGPAIKSFGTSAWESIKSFFGASGTSGINSITTIFENIKTALVNAWNSVYDWVTNVLLKSPIVQNMIEFGKLFGTAIKDFFTMDTSGEKTLGEKLLKRLTAFDPVIDWIKEKFSALKDAVSGEDGLVAKIKKFFTPDEGSVLGSIVSGIEAFGKNIFGSGLDAAWDTVKKGFKIFIIATVVRALSRISKSFAILTGAAQKSSDSGKTVLKMAISIGIIAGVLYLLSKIDAGAALAGVAVMAVALAALVGAVALLNKVGKDTKGIGSGILQMALGIGVVVLAIWGVTKLISSTDPGLMWTSIGMVAGILVALGAVAWAISKFGKNGGTTGGAATVLALCVGLLFVVRAIGNVSELLTKHKNAWEAFGMVEALIATIGLVAVLIGAFGKSGDSDREAKAIVALCLTLSAVVSAIGKMANLIRKYPENIDKAFWMIEGILITVGGIAVLIGLVSSKAGFLQSLASVAPILAMGWVLENIAGALSKAIVAIKDVNVDVIDTFMGRLEGTIAIVAGVCAAFAAIPIKLSLKAALALVVLMAAIGLGLDIVATFAADAIEKMSEAIRIVGIDLSNFNDDISDYNESKVSSVMNSLTNTLLPAMGELVLKSGTVADASDATGEIWRFGIKLKMFNNSISGITAESGSAITQFATDIGTVVGIINGIEGVEAAKSVLEGLGAAINLYYTNLKGIPAGTSDNLNTDEEGNFNVEAANAAFQALAELTLDDATLDKIKSYAGEDGGKLNGFAEGVVNIGAALKSYGENIGTLKETDINNANLILDKVTEIQGKLTAPSWDALTGAVPEKSVLDEFSIDIVALGEALGEYGNSISGLSLGKIFLANTVIGAVAALNDKLPKTGGLLQFFTGEQSLEHFAVNMSRLGTGMKNYADAVKDADFEKVSASVGPMEAMAAISQSLDKTGGLQEILNGKKDLGTLGDGLEAFGTDLMTFYEKVQNFDATNKPLTDALGVLSQLVEIQSKIRILEDAQMGLGLAEIAWEFSRFFELMSGETVEGQGIRYAIESGIEAINGYRDQFVAAGKNLDAGLAEGITKGQSQPITAAAFMAAQTYLRALKVLKIHSPSKVFEWMGKMVDMGLEAGLTDFKDIAVNAVSNVSNAVIDEAGSSFGGFWDTIKSSFGDPDSLVGSLNDGLNTLDGLIGQYTQKIEDGATEKIGTAVGGVLDWLDIDIDASPTITPVMDLSEVYAGSAQIASMFGNQTIGTSLNLAGDISTSKGVTIVQNASSDNSAQIVEAINSLNDRMNQVAAQMSSLRVVMDTGAIVGQIAGPIDRQLGIRASQSARRG